MLTSSLPNYINPTQQRRFVRQFTHRVAGDALLGCAFAGQPFPPDDGEYTWWEQALTGGHYTGRPLHRDAVPLFTAQQIERWCRLLEASLDEVFSGPTAAEVKGHVLNLATMLAHWQRSQWRVAAEAARQPAVLVAA